MTALAHHARLGRRVAPILRDESAAVRVAFGAVALHVADDNLFQPNPGTSTADHLTPGLGGVAALVAVAWLYPRLRAGARAVLALAGGFAALLVSSEAVHYSRAGGPTGDDFTGLATIPAGFLLLGIGASLLWRSRRRDDAPWWRYGRRLLFAGGTWVVASVVLLPVSVAYVVTHASRAYVPVANLGAPHEDVEFTTSDGVRLNGWYIRSRNGAAVISFPGRASTQKRAKLLARHGYGVLLVDRRGEGESEGDPNLFGWQGERDVDAAVTYLRGRPDVDPHRIGGIGLSVGGEMLIAAAAHSTGLRAIVTEGASGRSLRDDLANPGAPWDGIVADAVVTAATAAFSGDTPPADLRGMVPHIRAATFFIYGERGQLMEEPANRAFYAAATGPKQLWEVPGSGHIGGTEARPAEYERRVVAFFDRELAP